MFSGVYRFFPVDLDAIKTTNARMYEAGLALVVRTRETMDLILKWLAPHFSQLKLLIIIRMYNTVDDRGLNLGIPTRYMITLSCTVI